MASWFGWTLAGLVAATVAVIWNHKSRVRMEDRVEASIGMIWEQHYRSQGIALATVEQCYQEIADACGLSLPGRLRPDDRFAVELRPPHGWEWDSGLAVLSAEFQERAEKAGIRPESVSSVADYVVAIDRLQRQDVSESAAPDRS